MKAMICSIFLSLFLCACHKSPIEPYSILPEPVSITYTSGKYKLPTNATIAYPTQLAGEAKLLQSYLERDLDMRASLHEGEKRGDILLEIDPSVAPDKEEGYRLEVESHTLSIKATTPQGVLHGVHSLLQIIHKERGHFVVQKGTITDYPSFSWRAFMLDEGRYFKGKEVVCDLLDEMARLKMNVFHWHLTEDHGWRIEIKKYPLLTKVGAYRDSSEINHFESNLYDGTPHGGFYTQDEIKEVIDYATQRHITIVPEIEMPGHASAAIAAYPWLGTEGKEIKVPCKFGVQYEVYNVADPRVKAFLVDVMDEVIALFPGSVFHIGGDEVKYDQWKASPMIRAYMATHKLSTPAELQVFFTNEISNILASKSRRMMGWNEITGAKLHEYQSSDDTDVQQKLAPGTIVHFWKGDPELIKQAINRGYDVVNSYHIYTYLDYDYKTIPLKKAYSFNPIPEGLTKEEEKKVLGLGCQMWGEFIPTVASMNHMVFPRLAAYAEGGWTAEEKKDYTRFRKSLFHYEERWNKEGRKNLTGQNPVIEK